ncbi:MAG: hypothetical protein MR902_07700 [Campylobacter sp.]|nr:hypothetical protein [Campylobacter sp.]
MFWAREPDGLEISLLNKIYSLPFTLLFIDGNHENFDHLNTMKTISKFGGKVEYGGDNLFWLKRSEIYSIDGFNIFTFGGALSVDKHFRKEGISWWHEEIPSANELNLALQNIQNFIKNGGKIDTVLTHTLPNFAIKKLLSLRKAMKFPDLTADMLEQIFEVLKPKKGIVGISYG